MVEFVTDQCHKWSSTERLNDLLQRLTQCLTELPGFEALSLFGSLSNGRADGYSDIDLNVMTADLPAAQRHLLEVLESVGPVESSWVIGARPGEWSSTIIFTEEGYYHRVDIGLVSTDVSNLTFLSCMTPCKSQAYAPSKGSVGHFLLGQYIGGLRYLKARRRGQALTCYRFISAAVDWCLCALHAKLAGDSTFDCKLSTEEYAALDRLNATEHCSTILGSLDYSTPAKMDQSACQILTQVYNVCRDIADAHNQTIDNAVFQRMLEFMHHELQIAI